MAGWLFFGGEDGISVGSSAIDFIASYLRPYITGVSTEVMGKVYETHDLFDDTLDFFRFIIKRLYAFLQPVIKIF